jgi:hypothetical protein
MSKMTRKDYIAIGEAVAKIIGRNIAVEERYPGDSAELVSDIGSQLLNELSHVFNEDNARFDRARFAEFFCEKEEEARAEKASSF